MLALFFKTCLSSGGLFVACFAASVAVSQAPVSRVTVVVKGFLAAVNPKFVKAEFACVQALHVAILSLLVDAPSHVRVRMQLVSFCLQTFSCKCRLPYTVQNHVFP